MAPCSAGTLETIHRNLRQSSLKHILAGPTNAKKVGFLLSLNNIRPINFLEKVCMQLTLLFIIILFSQTRTMNRSLMVARSYFMLWSTLQQKARSKRSLQLQHDTTSTARIVCARVIGCGIVSHLVERHWLSQQPRFNMEKPSG